MSAIDNRLRRTPITVESRIEKLQADERHLQRRVTEQTYYSDEHGYQDPTPEKQAARAEALVPRLTELRDEVEFREGVVAEQIATGKATNYARHNVPQGDSALVCGTCW